MGVALKSRQQNHREQELSGGEMNVVNNSLIVGTSDSDNSRWLHKKDVHIFVFKLDIKSGVEIDPNSVIQIINTR